MLLFSSNFLKYSSRAFSIFSKESELIFNKSFIVFFLLSFSSISLLVYSRSNNIFFILIIEIFDGLNTPLTLLIAFFNSVFLTIRLFSRARFIFVEFSLIKLKIYSSYPLIESVSVFSIFPFKISFIVLD